MLEKLAQILGFIRAPKRYMDSSGAIRRTNS